VRACGWSGEETTSWSPRPHEGWYAKLGRVECPSDHYYEHSTWPSAAVTQPDCGRSAWGVDGWADRYGGAAAAGAGSQVNRQVSPGKDLRPAAGLSAYRFMLSTYGSFNPLPTEFH